MDKPRIINNVAREMPGVRSDLSDLKDAYETVGFDVEIHEDLDAQV